MMLKTTDILERIYDLELDPGCPLHLAAAALKPDFSGRRRIVSGRGLTRDDAVAACSAEAVERWCAVFSQSMFLMRGREDEFDLPAVNPESLLLISNRQYDSASGWNSTVERDHHLPDRRSADEPITWLKAQSLTRHGELLVPAAYCLLGFPWAREQGFPIPDSSGLAAGDDIESCTARGLLELVERDAVSIWWYGRIPRPELQIDRRSLPLLERFEAWLERLGRRMWLLDLTHDLGIPVVAAVSCDENGRNLSFGFAASWTRKGAATSALGELVQFDASKRLAQWAGRNTVKNFVTWCETASVKDYPFICASPAGDPPSVTVFDREGKASTKLLNQKGLELITLNLTRPDLPLSVVRVIVPGLRPIWPRFAAGRLYDVPLSLGWHSERLTEDQLNPVPILY